MEERRVKKCGDLNYCLVVMMMATIIGVSLLIFLTVVQTFGDDTSLTSLSNKALSTQILSRPHQEISPLLFPQPRQKREEGEEWKEGGEPPRSHQLPCNKGEQHETACFKGECYALDLGGLRSPFCQCPEMYEGPRCERLTAYFYLGELTKAAIIGGTIFGIVLIIVAVSVYCTYRKRRGRRKCAGGSVDELGTTKDTDAATDESKDNIILQFSSSEISKAAHALPAPCQVHHTEIVFPRIATTPYARGRPSRIQKPEEEIPPFFRLMLTWRGRQRRLTLFRSDVTSWRTVTLYDDVGRNDSVAETAGDNCQFQGFVSGDEHSSAAMSVCQGLAGSVQMEEEVVFIEPVDAAKNVERLWHRRPHRVYTCMERTMLDSSSTDLKELSSQNSTHGSDRDDDNRFSQRRGRQQRRQRRQRRGRRSVERRRYLEVQVVVDHTVTGMQGSKRVQQYVLTLMNIANSVYQHPSLGVSLRVVVTELIFLQQKDQKDVLVKKDAFATVQKFCAWSKGRHPPSRAIRHDVAFLLTRQNLGPAGYAPITGMCDPSRSCAVVTDEGFTSGFIIAHELAHVLGLVHDGQGNACSGPAYSSAIMAPLVEAKLHRFRWSECSRTRMQEVIRYLFCLNDNPDIDSEIDDHYALDSGHEFPYDMGRLWSLNFQCRLEFGYGSRLCSVFRADACNVLWCTDPSSPYLCRTKRGPPVPGTNCGYSMECRDRLCVYVGRERAVNGGWSAWGEWGDCSLACGVGITRRRRFCSDPRPAYGGRHCVGEAESWDTCLSRKGCRKRYDLRALQCAGWNELRVRIGDHDWQPYPAKHEWEGCQQTCVSSSTGEVVSRRVHVTDGTPCDYGHSTDICFRGKCLEVGCDGVQRSNKTFDSCGVCDGDHSQCKTVSGQVTRQPFSENQYEPVVFLPKGCRHIDVVKRGKSSHFIALRKAEDDSYVLNGNRTREDSREFVVAGALFEYERKFGYQHIRSLGPLHEPLEVMLYPEHDMTEASVAYEYIVKKDDLTIERRRYLWRHKEWSPCSVSCGEGVKSAVQACYDRDTGDERSETTCRYLRSPEQQTDPCLQDPCPQKTHVWTPTEDWSSCNATECGEEGVQTQSHMCQAHYSNDTYINVNISLCDPHSLPMVTRNCSAPPCGLTWTISEWSECSVSCGQGRQRRSAYCGNPHTDSDDVWCKDKPPALSRTCEKRPCEVTTTTSREDDDCRDKLSICQLSDEGLAMKCHSRLFHKMCCQACRRQQNAARRPRLSQRAIYRWILVDDLWGPCSAEGCGEEGEERQGYRCVVYFQNNASSLAVTPDLCGDPQSAPKVSRKCAAPPCDMVWTTVPWSECSMTCGQGLQRRSAYCGNPHTDSDDVWCKDTLPSLSRTCNMGPCKGVKARRRLCADKYSFCRHIIGLGVKCRSKGFRRICCRSCRRVRRTARKPAGRRRAAKKPAASGHKRTARKRAGNESVAKKQIRAGKTFLSRKRAKTSSRRRVVKKHPAAKRTSKKLVKKLPAKKRRLKNRSVKKHSAHKNNNNKKKSASKHIAKDRTAKERAKENKPPNIKTTSTPAVNIKAAADAPSQWDLYRRRLFKRY
ncbi:hypothetical protein ACOMHN_030009 [Nucella lapillus]